MNITETILKAREGDSDAVAALFNEYKNDVYYLGRKIIGNDRDADNILQYSYFQAFHKLGVLRNPENFKVWLYIIAANRCRFLMHEKNPSLFPPPESGKKIPRANYDIKNDMDIPSVAADDVEARNAISSLVDKLHPMLRTAVMLYFYCGLNFGQTAKIMNCNESAVKYFLARATGQLNNEINSLVTAVPSLVSYSGMEEIGIILRRACYDFNLSDSLCDEIINTSVTLALSSAVSREEKENIPSENDQIKDYGQDIKINLEDEIPSNTEKKAAIRNIIMITAVILIAAAIVIGSVFAIKNVINTDSGIKSTDKNTENEKNSDSLESENDTSSSEAASSDTTDTTAESESQTTAKETETESDMTTKPEETTTEAAETTVPAETQPQNTMTAEEITYSFDVQLADNAVTITKYKGEAKEVDIPSMIQGKPVTAIGWKAFDKSSSIVSVIIPETVTDIKGYAFSECESLVMVSLPSSLVNIDAYAFYKCKNLTNIKIPNGVKSVGASAFSETGWLISQKNAYIIGGDGILIRYNGADVNTTVPESVKKISNAFYYHSKLQKVIIQPGVTELGVYSFASCPALISVSIPESVTSIDKDAIYNCPALTEIRVTEGSFADSWCRDNGYEAAIVYN